MPVHEVPGGLGKFEYEFSANALNIHLPMSFEFLAGDKTKSPGFGADEYLWQDEPEKNYFKQEFLAQTKSTWEGVFGFHGFDTTGSEPDIELDFTVDLVERTDPIWRVFAFRDPGDDTTPSASVCEPGSRHFGAGCDAHPTPEGWGSLSMSSALTEPIEKQIGEGDTYKVWFKPKSLDFSLGSDLYFEMHDIIRRLKLDAGWTARLIGSASLSETSSAATNDSNPHPAIDLARRRTAKLTEFFESRGVNSGNLSKTIRNPLLQTQPGDYAFVEIIVSSDRQSTFAHEVGHFFGLEDEYVSPNHPRGTRLQSQAYVQMINDWSFVVPVYGPSRSIMSAGNTLYPRHFTPFLDLLKTVRPTYDWYLATA